MPNNSIKDIKDYFSRHKGLQRTNRFDIGFINLPAAPAAHVDSSSFYPVQAVTIGGRGMEFVADNLSGFKNGRIQPRSQKITEEVLITFSVTNDSHILKMFNSWFNYLYSGSRVKGTGADLTLKFNVPYYNDAVKNVGMKIRLLDPNGGTNLTYTFYEVMPAEMFPLTLDMNAKEPGYLTLQVQMVFKEFRQD